MRLTDDLYAFPWQILTVNNCNSYLIDGPFRILIDPGHQHLFAELEGSLRALDITPRDINLVIGTHIHPDHIEAAGSFSSSSTLVTMHEKEYEYFRDMVSRTYVLNREPDFLMTEGTLKAGGIELEVIHTPGHSPGSACLYWPARKALFAGDLIFERGVGRTDLPGGDGRQLKESISRLSSFDIELLLPGHGNIIRGKEEVDRNFSLVEHTYFGLL
jgi:glyoxylase-like metal-dependent hydrolase (beta-lactamase superfamily II)